MLSPCLASRGRWRCGVAWHSLVNLLILPPRCRKAFPSGFPRRPWKWRRFFCEERGLGRVGWQYGGVWDKSHTCESFQPKLSFLSLEHCLADTLTANVLQDSWEGPWGLPDCRCFFKHAATLPYIVSSRNTLVSIFSDVRWKKYTRVSKYYHMVHDLILLLMSSRIKYLLKASDDDVLILILETSSPITHFFF